MPATERNNIHTARRVKLPDTRHIRTTPPESVTRRICCDEIKPLKRAAYSWLPRQNQSPASVVVEETHQHMRRAYPQSPADISIRSPGITRTCCSEN